MPPDAAEGAVEPSVSLGARSAILLYSWGWIAWLVVLDSLAFLLSAYLAGGFVDRTWSLVHFRSRLVSSSFVFISLWMASFWCLGLYRRSLALSMRDEYYYTIVALIVGVIPQLVLFTLMSSLSTSRLVLITSLLCAVVLVGGIRSVLHGVRAASTRHTPRKIAIVGAASDANLLSHVGFDTSEQTIVDEISLGEISNSDTSWAEKLISGGYDTIVLIKLLPTGIMRRLLKRAASKGTRVTHVAQATMCDDPTAGAKMRSRHVLLVPQPLYACGPSVSILKRLTDIALGALLLILSLPIMLLAAILILVDSGNPVFYRQQRVGLNGRLFNIVKFRTMRPGSEQTWATFGDARITKVGAFLRRTSIDELPQLFNVLHGDMSLVGPRPEMQEYAEQFERSLDRYKERTLVRPGITGWAQINMKRTLAPSDMPTVLAYDLFYIENYSLYMDLAIMFKTAVEVLFHHVA